MNDLPLKDSQPSELLVAVPLIFLGAYAVSLLLRYAVGVSDYSPVFNTTVALIPAFAAASALLLVKYEPVASRWKHVRQSTDNLWLLSLRLYFLGSVVGEIASIVGLMDNSSRVDVRIAVVATLFGILFFFGFFATLTMPANNGRFWRVLNGVLIVGTFAGCAFWLTRVF